MPDLVVFLRGMNVGGHRTFRPMLLAERLQRFNVRSIGAAGTFVVRQPASQAIVRAAFARHLPVDAHVMVCPGGDVRRLVASNPFAGRRLGPEVVPFVSVLARRGRPSVRLPWHVPATGRWVLRVLGRQGRFVFGMYRREMRAIGQLARIDAIFGAPATTRSWTTILAIARTLDGP